MLWLWEDIWRFGNVSAAFKYCNCDRLWSMYLSMSSGPPIPYGKGSSVWKAVIFTKFVFNVKANFLMFSKTQFWRESFVCPTPKTMRLGSLTCHTSDHCWRQRLHEHIAIPVTVLWVIHPLFATSEDRQLLLICVNRIKILHPRLAWDRRACARLIQGYINIVKHKVIKGF